MSAPTWRSRAQAHASRKGPRRTDANRRAKEFFIRTDYSESWTTKIRLCNWSEGYDRSFIELLLADSPTDVLEVGTGEGRFIPTIVDRGCRYFGIDISRRMLHKASERLRGPIRQGEAHLICADAENLPFKNGSFDSVFFSATLFFVPNWRKALDEASRVSNGAVLTEFRNSASPALLIEHAKAILLHAAPLKLLRLVSKGPLLRSVKLFLQALYGRQRTEKFFRSGRAEHAQPFFPVTPWSLTRYHRNSGLRMTLVVGFGLPSLRKRASRAHSLRTWFSPVLVVKTSKNAA